MSGALCRIHTLMQYVKISASIISPVYSPDHMIGRYIPRRWPYSLNDRYQAETTADKTRLGTEIVASLRLCSPFLE